MLADPNVVFLGPMAANDTAMLAFVDGEVGPDDDFDEIEPLADFDWLYHFEADGDVLTLWDDGTGDRAVRVEGGDTRFYGDVRADGYENVNFVSEFTRITGFDASDVHEFRRSESDSDQIFEIERRGTSDYEFRVYHDGSARPMLLEGADVALGDVEAGTVSVDGDAVVTESDNRFPDVENDGMDTVEDVTLLNFGDDLGVTDDGANAVTIDYVGAEIPSLVMQDGVTVAEEANGLDFVGHFEVSEGTDGEAVVELDAPEDLASTSETETVTAVWEFLETIIGTVEHALEADHAGTADSATSADSADSAGWADDAGIANWANEADHADTASHADTADSATSADHATEADWANEAEELAGFTPADFAEVAESETVTGSWLFDGGPRIRNGTYLRFGSDSAYRFRYSSTNGRLELTDHSGAAEDVIHFHDGGAPEFHRTPTVGGDDVLTRGDEATLEVAHADEADTLVGSGLEDLAQLDEDETVTGDYEFTGTVNVTGRLNLPVYEGEDPTGTETGDVWVRPDEPT